MDAAIHGMMQIVAIAFWFMVFVLVADMVIDALKWGKEKFIKYKDARNAKKYAKWKSEKW